MAKTKRQNQKKTPSKKANKNKKNNKTKTKTKRSNKTNIPPKKEQDIYVVLFYAEWCPHCQHMKPEWEQLKQTYENNNNNIQIIDVESSDSNKNEILEELNKKVAPNNIMIDGYPTILSVNGDEIDYYRGERTANMMVGWISKMTGGYRKELQLKSSSKSVKTPKSVKSSKSA